MLFLKLYKPTLNGLNVSFGNDTLQVSSYKNNSLKITDYPRVNLTRYANGGFIMKDKTSSNK